MHEDFLKELGYLALATRLKRISDRMIHSGRMMYKALDMDIEPNWYMVFKLLQKHKELSVTQIADRLQLAHPSIISIIGKMTEAGYLEGNKCEKDGRRQLLQLTEKARKSLPQFEEVWEAGTRGVEKMMKEHDILPLLGHLEAQLSKQNFKERTFAETTPIKNA